MPLVLLPNAAVEELRTLMAKLPTEDGKDHVDDMVCWAAEYGADLMRELDSNRVPSRPPPPP